MLKYFKTLFIIFIQIAQKEIKHDFNITDLGVENAICFVL